MPAKRCHFCPKINVAFDAKDSNQSSTVKRQNHILWRLSKVFGIFNNVCVQLTFVFIDMLISSLFVKEIYFILFVTCYVNRYNYLVKLEWKRSALRVLDLKGLGYKIEFKYFDRNISNMFSPKPWEMAMTTSHPRSILKIRKPGKVFI